MTIPEEEREAIAHRLNRVAYHLEDGLGPNGLLGPYTEEQADAVRGLVDDLDYVLNWLEAQPEVPESEPMQMPDEVRGWIESAAKVASDSARYYDADSSSSDAVLAWLDAQPDAPERWEPVDGWVDCACCSLDCGEYAATADYRGIWYLRVEDQEGHAEITLPDDVRLCRRVEVTE